MKYIDRWCIDMFRISTIMKDYELEDEVQFILSEKRKIYTNKTIK